MNDSSIAIVSTGAHGGSGVQGGSRSPVQLDVDRVDVTSGGPPAP